MSRLIALTEDQMRRALRDAELRDMEIRACVLSDEQHYALMREQIVQRLREAMWSRAVRQS